MTVREAFNKTQRVFVAAGRFCGMQSKEAQIYGLVEAARLWPEEAARKNKISLARLKERTLAGDPKALVSEAKRILREDRKKAKVRGFAPIRETPESLAPKLHTTLCECCGAAFKNSNDRHTDHCHATGKFRGMLCRDCNLAEGYLKTVERAWKVLSYMDRHSRGDA